MPWIFALKENCQEINRNDLSHDIDYIAPYNGRLSKYIALKLIPSCRDIAMYRVPTGGGFAPPVVAICWD